MLCESHYVLLFGFLEARLLRFVVFQYYAVYLCFYFVVAADEGVKVGPKNIEIEHTKKEASAFI